MVFLFAILAGWFSRGIFLQICLEQEKRMLLFLVFWGAVILSSPIQGYMSDLTSRKRVMLFALSAVIVSLLTVYFAPQFFPLDKFSVILTIAVVINGVFGNVSPAAGAALSEKTNDIKRSFFRVLASRYAALIIPFLLPFAQRGKLLLGTMLSVAAFVGVVVAVEKGKIIPLEKR